MEMKYKVWETNKFNSGLMQNVIAAFTTLELAQEYVDFKSQLGESCIVAELGKKIYPID